MDSGTGTDSAETATQLPLVVTVEELSSPQPACSGSFVTHTLEHTTTVTGEVVRMFESNGAGLAINDLDNDGDLDIVLANLAGSNSILWNEGELRFLKEELSHGESRDVKIVDVDGDGWQDIVFSRRLRTRPVLWINQGSATAPGFRQADSFAVKNPYTMAWADLDGDGDLDLVVATYDIESTRAGDHRNPFAGGGIIAYAQTGDAFHPTYLAFEAQTLALLVADLDKDGRPDIMAGNDFLQPDLVWLADKEGWTEVRPFTQMTANTMSLDAGDVDNDGQQEIFAADMVPYADDAVTEAAWQPLVEQMHAQHHAADDPQIMENVLQVRTETGRFENRARSAGVAASGWSWSGKFGDLDNDGYLDLYVVNGMVAEEMFGHLPGHELVEENQAFRNVGDGRFVPAPAWGLNSRAGGRGMSMADLDADGDLDIVVNNLLAPAQLFENRLCTGQAIEVDLLWPQSKNTRAIGATLTLYTDVGALTRDVRSGSGYLSGDPARIHFGFPAGSQLHRLEIRWPDGRLSSVESLQPQTRLSIQRDGS